MLAFAHVLPIWQGLHGSDINFSTPNVDFIKFTFFTDNAGNKVVLTFFYPADTTYLALH